MAEKKANLEERRQRKLESWQRSWMVKDGIICKPPMPAILQNYDFMDDDDRETKSGYEVFEICDEKIEDVTDLDNEEEIFEEGDESEASDHEELDDFLY